jgi:hypothetical protein
MDILNWRKARASAANGDCIEVADHDGAVLVRDTKVRERGHLAVDAADWRAFTASIKAMGRLGTEEHYEGGVPSRGEIPRCR